MKRVVNCLIIYIFSAFTTTALAQDYMEGVEYKKLAKPQQTATADKVEVVELFWYGCPHCFYLEPHIKKWQASKPEDVEFIRLPAILGPSWELLAKAWYTADLLGVTDTIHLALFEELHVRKKKVSSADTVREFFIAHNVSAADFDKTFNSFAVAVKVNNARLMTQRYAITGVPTVIVNGKYSTSASLAGGNPEVIQVVDFLVEQERKQAVAVDAPAVTAVGQ